MGVTRTVQNGVLVDGQKLDNLPGDTSAELALKVDKIAGKGLSEEDYTTAEKSKLAGIPSDAEANTVDSVNTKTGSVVLNQTDIGLPEVDNTSDASKPVSTATQTALDLKADKDGETITNASVNGVTLTDAGGGTDYLANDGTYKSIAAGGTVTEVTSTNADIDVATGTTTPELTLNSGTGADQIVKLDGTAKLPAVDGSQLTNLPSQGDVVGPSSAVDENIAVFDSTTGKLIKDGGSKISDFVETVDHDQVYFLGKHGNDSNDGLTEEKAFLTFGAAITEAEAQTPTITNRFVIYCNDAGVYTEDVTSSDWVDIKAQSAVIDGSLTVGNNTSSRICTINKIIKSSTSGRAYIDCCLVDTPDGEVGVLNSGTGSILTIFARKIVAPLNGIGIKHTGTGDSHTHCLVNDLIIEGNSGIGVQTEAGRVAGIIDLIEEEGTPTTTTGIKTIGGETNLTVSTIETDTVWDVAASTTLRLSIQSATGTRTVADGGVAEVSEAAKSTDDLAATGMVNGGGAISLNADITKVDIAAAIYYIQGTRYVYAGGTAIDPDFQTGEDTSNLGLDASGLVKQIGKFTSAQKQTIIPLGLCTATQGQTGAGSDVGLIRDDRFIISEVGYIQRLWQEEAIGTLYASGGIISENGSTPLQLDQAAGVLYDKQRKRQVLSSDENIEAVEFYHVSGSWDAQTKATLVIDVLQYDDGTDLATLSNPNKWASHTLLKSPKGETGGTPEGGYFLVFSQGQYDSQGEAEAVAPNYGPFVDQATSGVVAIAQIVVNKSTANINAVLDKRPIISATSGASSVTGTATLQQTYDNSSTPEMLTDATRGALTIQRGSAADTDNVFEGKNGAGTTTFEVDGNGDITGNNLSGTNTGDQTSIVGITGTTAEFNTALSDADFATGGGTVTGASSGTNTGDQTSIVGITGTKAQFDTAVTDGNITYDGDNVSVLTNDAGYITESSTDTLTNKSGSNSQWTNDEGYTTNTGTVTPSSSDTLTNKTIDANGTGNSISNLETADIAAAAKTGADTKIVTGTEGTNGNLVEWNADGDAVDSSLATSDVVTGASTDTFTNKTFDANGTGNSISNIDVADLADGTDGELITWDSAGAPATILVGTADQVLTSNGIGEAPTFQDAGGGAAKTEIDVYYNSGNIAADSGAYTKVTLNTENFDTLSEFDSTTNYRFTATEAGKYLVTGSIQWSAQVVDKQWLTAIYKNGTKFVEAQITDARTGVVTPNVTRIISLSVDDYIELYGVQYSGASAVMQGNSTKTFMSIVKV